MGDCKDDKLRTFLLSGRHQLRLDPLRMVEGRRRRRHQPEADLSRGRHRSKTGRTDRVSQSRQHVGHLPRRDLLGPEVQHHPRTLDPGPGGMVASRRVGEPGRRIPE